MVEDFVERYQRRVYGLAHAMLGDSHQAEDVAQEAFVRAWKHARDYDPRRAAVSSWMLTIARNLATDVLRRRREVPREPEQLLRSLSDAWVDRDGADEIVDADLVRDALCNLPPDQSRALVLSVFGGRTAEEIAEAEGIPLGTAKSRIRAGMRRMRAMLCDAEETA